MNRQGSERTVLCFDYGMKRIGVAVGQTVSRTATSVGILPAKNGVPVWEDLSRIVDDWQPNVFVLGRPHYRDGSQHSLDGAIERFSRRLIGRYKIPVEFMDEHLSSFAAQDTVSDSGTALDAEAARLILLTWLEQVTNDKTMARE